MHTRLKLFSLSDENERGDALLTLIRADNEKYAVTLNRGDIDYWEARIAAIKQKRAEKNAELAARQSS
jgi:hypothetical protein